MSHQEKAPEPDPGHAGETMSLGLPGNTLEYSRKSWKKFLGRGKSRHLAAAPTTRIRKKQEKTGRSKRLVHEVVSKMGSSSEGTQPSAQCLCVGSVRQVDLPQKSLTLNVWSRPGPANMPPPLGGSLSSQSFLSWQWKLAPQWSRWIL